MLVSNDFARLPLSEIEVLRDERQRQKLDVSDLLDSIETYGVLLPVIVRRTVGPFGTHYTLIAGERRLEASRQLALPDIPVRFIDQMSESEAQLIELEENVRRQDLHWRDYVRTLDRIHKLHLEMDTTWNQSKSADLLNIDATIVSKVLRVARDIDNPKLQGADSWTAAFNILSRMDERRFAALMTDILESAPTVASLEAAAQQVATAQDLMEDADGVFDGEAPEAPGTLREVARAAVAAPPPAFISPDAILNSSFLEWAPAYSGPRFNFIHCDFPYGIDFNAGKQGGRNDWAGYDDSPEVYWELLKCLCEHRERLFSPSSHLLFWFSMDYYWETLEFFRQHFPALVVQRHPIYWHKTDNVGILPDPKRGPRRVVETALIASLGDRPIVRTVSNAYGAPTDKTIHQSTKPEPMLRHFFGMFVDESTRMLDPTCGSGSALRAAESLGAEGVLGLEINPEHAEAATDALKRARRLRGVAK